MRIYILMLVRAEIRIDGRGGLDSNHTMTCHAQRRVECSRVEERGQEADGMHLLEVSVKLPIAEEPVSIEERGFDVAAEVGEGIAKGADG